MGSQESIGMRARFHLLTNKTRVNNAIYLWNAVGDDGNGEKSW